MHAWASYKGFRPRDGGYAGLPTGGGRGASAEFRGQKRCNNTHDSTTDPGALIYRKSKCLPSMLRYQEYLVTDNRNDLVVRAPQDGGPRPQLRHSRVRASRAGAWYHAPRHVQRQRQPHQPDRWPNNLTRRIRHKPRQA